MDSIGRIEFMEYTLVSLDTVDSTNVYAEEQTAGKGRLGRKWLSPRGENICATFCFQLPKTTLHLVSLAQVASLSLAKVLLHAGLLPKVKWPNDVQLNGKKLAGVLCETSFHQDTVDLFLGIGINVNTTAENLALIDQAATSLLTETKKKWDRDALLKTLLHQFSEDLVSFKKAGFTPFHNPYENLLAYKGQKIRCFDGKREWVGICHSITNDGQLNLYLPNQEIHTLLSGDLTFI